MSRNSLFQFLTKPINFQIQSMFEFRYPVLFDDDSFLIDQLNFPQIEANTGLVYLDGYPIPVHSTGKFGNNEITFSMYVEEEDFSLGRKGAGKYYKIFNSLLSQDHTLIDDVRSGITDSALVAKIIPVSAQVNGEAGYYDLDVNNRTTILYNALIKSMSLSGGFSSNSQTLAKFDVSMTFSFMEHYYRRFEISQDGETLD